MQGPGDGRGGQGQHVNAGAPLLHFLLLGHPKALFLVDDEEPQGLEGDVRGQNPVGADDDVNLAGGQFLDDFPLLLGGPEAAEHFDIHAKGGHALGKGQQVLLGQDGGRGQDGYLHAVHHGLEGGPNGHLGFAVAHVAAQEPVHGNGLFHIGLDFRNGFQLVRGFLKGEAVLEFLLEGGIRGKGMARGDFPLGVQPQQLGGQDGNGLLGLGPGFLPVVPAHIGQLGRGALVADVFVQQAHLLYGYVELVALGVLELQVVPMDAVNDDGLHAHVAADALDVVDHVIPH